MAKKKRKRNPNDGGGRHTPAKRNNAPARDTPGGFVPQVTLTSTSTYSESSGPLPPAEALAKYEEVQPGLAERIIRLAERPMEMAEHQQAHRIALEKKVIASDIRRSWGGLVVGALVALLAVSGGIYLLANDKTVVGLGAVLAGLGTPVGAFLYADSRRRAERRDQSAENP